MDTMWLWFMLLGVVGMTVSVAFERSVLTLFILAVVLLLLEFVAKINVWSYVTVNWQFILICLAAYIPVGVLWSFFKWLLVLRSAKLRYEAKRAKFLMGHGVNTGCEIPEHLVKEWREEVYGRYDEHPKDDFCPRASEHKNSILCWIGYWPFSVLATVLGDLVEHIVQEVYAKISTAYARLADRIIGDRIRIDVAHKMNKQE
jgi:hypothetical protein